MGQEHRGLGAAALAAGAIGIAFSAVLNKLAMGAGLHPVWLNVFRVGVAMLLMLPFFLKKAESRQAVRRMGRREWLLSLLSGVVLAAHFATWATALKYADSVIAVSIWSTFSLMTVLGSAVLLKERTPLPALLGIVLAIVGVCVCAIGARGPETLGVLMALLAAVTQAVYTLCGRAVRKKVGTMPYTMVVYSISFAALLLLALLLRLPTDGMNAEGIGASTGLAVVCTLLGHSMQSYALKYYKAPTVSAAILTEVFTGPMLVYLILGEAPKLVSVVGGAIILCGVAWYMIYEGRHSDGTVRSRQSAPERARV